MAPSLKDICITNCSSLVEVSDLLESLSTSARSIIILECPNIKRLSDLAIERMMSAQKLKIEMCSKVEANWSWLFEISGEIKLVTISDHQLDEFSSKFTCILQICCFQDCPNLTSQPPLQIWNVKTKEMSGRHLFEVPLHDHSWEATSSNVSSSSRIPSVEYGLCHDTSFCETNRQYLVISFKDILRND